MDGYAKVAQLMAKYEEFAILRRFKALNYQNLLYLQAEIIHLSDSLGNMARRDASHPDRLYYAKDWWTLAHGRGRSGRAQWKTVRRIRKKLEKYNDGLLKQAALAKLDSPNTEDLKFLISWFERPSMGCFPIRGLDLNAWDDEEDLAAVKPRVAGDPISKWFMNTVFPMYHRLVGEKLKDPESPELGDGIFTYEESRLAAVVHVFITVVASLLPLASMVVLFVVESYTQRLGIMVGFSACFAVALALMTNARRVEIFAATAAYAAVNAVFLTNTTPSQCS
ncbi:hypothetical protein GQ53DRAFT_828647 [Thozetella sp. PMI_491]|nr:hypothetical protein GQ53DRAFT_828647 [Thozetella sp. PMI_491]